MRNFFQGWRRKVGCVTLLMACAVSAGWVRSLVVRDQISFHGEGSYRQMASDSGSVRFGHATWLGRRARPASNWPVVELSDSLADESIDEFWEGIDLQWRWGTAGFDFGKGVDNRMLRQQIERWVIPYWSLTIPLTLLSACLILWKPRKQVT